MAPKGTTMPTTTTDDGVKIAYRTIGDGPLNVVLVHGWMVSSAVWTTMLESFESHGLKLIVPDLRGTGASDKPASGYGIERHAKDVMAVAAAEKASSFVVVGHSMGGQVAQWLAATEPASVRAVVALCSVPAVGMKLPPEAVQLFRNCGGSRESMQAILGMACKGLSPEAQVKALDDGIKTAKEAIEQGFDAWTGGGFRDKLGSIKAPTLAIATDDPFLPPDFLRAELTSLIPGARLAVLPGPGHYPQIERPRETAALLQAFLAGVRAS